MKVLMIGDVVGSPGRNIFKREVPRLRRELRPPTLIIRPINRVAKRIEPRNQPVRARDNELALLSKFARKPDRFVRVFRPGNHKLTFFHHYNLRIKNTR